MSDIVLTPVCSELCGLSGEYGEAAGEEEEVEGGSRRLENSRVKKRKFSNKKQINVMDYWQIEGTMNYLTFSEVVVGGSIN